MFYYFFWQISLSRPHHLVLVISLNYTKLYVHNSQRKINSILIIYLDKLLKKKKELLLLYTLDKFYKYFYSD